MKQTTTPARPHTSIGAYGLGATLRPAPVAPTPPMAVSQQLDADGIDVGRHAKYYVYVVEDGAVLWHQRDGSFTRNLGGRAVLNGYEAAVLATNYAGFAVPV